MSKVIIWWSCKRVQFVDWLTKNHGESRNKPRTNGDLLYNQSGISSQWRGNMNCIRGCCCCCLVAESCPTLCDPMNCIVHQAPLSMRFPRQESWSGLPFPSPGDLPDPGIEHGSPAWQADSLPLSPQGSWHKNSPITPMAAERPGCPVFPGDSLAPGITRCVWFHIYWNQIVPFEFTFFPMEFLK